MLEQGAQEISSKSNVKTKQNCQKVTFQNFGMDQRSNFTENGPKPYIKLRNVYSRKKS